MEKLKTGDAYNKAKEKLKQFKMEQLKEALGQENKLQNNSRISPNVVCSNRASGSLDKNKEQKKKKTWILIYPDKTESIMNYNPIKESKSSTLKQVREIINKSKCHCEMCAFGENCIKDEILIKASDLNKELDKI